MARRVFFSFHYQLDVQRAHVVRNSWVTKSDREEAGFFDSSVFESKKRTSDDALKQFLAAGLSKTSVTCVLAGSQTAHRRWVRYEILRSFFDSRGLMNIAVHNIKNFEGQVTTAGINPLSLLGAEVKGDTIFFKEHDGSKWIWARDIKKIAIRDVTYDLGGRTNFTFDKIFPTFDWVSNGGYANLASWIENAAKAAGR